MRRNEIQIVTHLTPSQDIFRALVRAQATFGILFLPIVVFLFFLVSNDSASACSVTQF